MLENFFTQNSRFKWLTLRALARVNLNNDEMKETGVKSLSLLMLEVSVEMFRQIGSRSLPLMVKYIDLENVTISRNHSKYSMSMAASREKSKFEYIQVHVLMERISGSELFITL